MDPSEFPKLINDCPPWYLLKRADDLNKIIISLKTAKEEEIKQSASVLEDIGFGILTQMYEPSAATEENRYDHHSLISYLCRINGMSISQFVWFTMALRKPQYTSRSCQKLINFLPDWADFLLSKAKSRRKTALFLVS